MEMTRGLNYIKVLKNYRINITYIMIHRMQHFNRLILFYNYVWNSYEL